MVVKMMNWRPWPPLPSKEFEVKIIIQQLQGLENGDDKSSIIQDNAKFAAEIKWKGSKANGLSLRRRSIKRNFTKEEPLKDDGVVEWNEEFQSVCTFLAYKDGSFHPWEVAFTIFNVSHSRQLEKIPIIATASLNIADFSCIAEQKDIEVIIPLQISSSNNEKKSSLCLTLSLLELITREHPYNMQSAVASLPTLSSAGEVLFTDKDDLSTVRTGLGKIRFLKGLSPGRAKKGLHGEEGSDGKSSIRSEESECLYPLDSDSLDDSDLGESEGGKGPHIKKSLSYGTLAYANHAGELYYSSTSSSEDEDLIYYSNHKIDAKNSYVDTSVINQLSGHGSLRIILPWRSRRLSFKNSKAKGEPLLKKYYGDDGGDDIDYDRRQLGSSDESSFALVKTEDHAVTNRSSVSEFGDDNFSVGCWEQKEILSRDGHKKLQAKVFFASIDQRSERAAGEGACTALVAVIADWFQSNRNEMPIKSQLDSLIREGSLEWRNLCENEAYRDRFPDNHFDLETVLQAKIRPLSVVPEKSFIGFFHPEGIEEGAFDFLQGAMSFDNIWDEISRSSPDSCNNADPLVYIVSWNDHFFILKVEEDAYYIVDTLGERLFEGCNQAFVLKFDRDASIHRVPAEAEKADDKPAADKPAQETIAEAEVAVSNEEESTVVCKGKDSCKEYIKSFLAAIPIRELQIDLKKGLMAATPLHHRLQIEFHYTKCLCPLLESNIGTIANTAEVLSLATF